MHVDIFHESKKEVLKNLKSAKLEIIKKKKQKINK